MRFNFLHDPLEHEYELPKTLWTPLFEGFLQKYNFNSKYISLMILKVKKTKTICGCNELEKKVKNWIKAAVNKLNFQISSIRQTKIPLWNLIWNLRSN